MDDGKYVYLGVFSGIAQVIIADEGNAFTAREVGKIIREGGTVERVPLAIGRHAFGEPWPPAEVAAQIEGAR